MTSKNKEYEHVAAKFDKIRREDTRPYRIKLFGKVVPVLPGVHSPARFSDVPWFVKEVPKLVGKRSLLEIGTGTGVIALFAALHGAERIVATDVNPAAVKNAKYTFRLHHLEIPVRLGNVFEPIKTSEKFDVIFWNHPFFYSPKKTKDMLIRGGFDYRYEGLRAFFVGAKKHLVPGGEVLLGTGKNARINSIKRMAREHGYSYTLVKKALIPSKSRKGVFIEARVYSFTK